MILRTFWNLWVIFWEYYSEEEDLYSKKVKLTSAS
jgi:hypothetical protein